ncbi:hypothetical protein [Pseudomonas pudica]|uniref:Uncharacterized protein n=1 Tax=Pseudomonas pudica TaxID=272772 RepID=A0ABS0G2K0_9PSED|nr:hypothetical protein [Pseudomonas pudica]MBF8646835.1 hypothetical protein [Pseudomonas pudica]MBF8760803.1 hypothetical protein [Pseudomonas pudica]
MLYRGVRLDHHEAAGGRICPRGGQIEVIPRHDGTIRYDGTFTYGYSENNAVRAHHIENGKWGGCFVSTSRNYEVAKFFATSDEFGQQYHGVVYHLDETLFSHHGVVAKEFDDPLYPQEEEVSIRAEDGGEIPAGVVVKVEEVFHPTAYRRNT